MGSPPNARTGSPASVTLLLEAAAGILYFTSVDQFLGCPDRAYGSGGLIEPFNEEKTLTLGPAELPNVPINAACMVVLAVQLILLCPVILLQLLVVHFWLRARPAHEDDEPEAVHT